MNTTQVAIYARVSCEQQASSNTIASQLSALLEQVSTDGYSCGQHLQFKDDGYSGSTLIRPALEQLRDAVALGEVDRLYVHSPDRLARKYAYQVVLVDEFSKAGVEVIFLNHPLGSSPEDDLLLQVQGMVAEYERAKILERSRRGKRHAAQRGSLNAFSRAPYGYDFISKHLNGGEVRMDINFTHSRHVQQMFEWYVYEHLSISSICRRLDSMSIPSPSGKKKWRVSTVSRILQNPHYKGSACFGKLRRGKKIDRPRHMYHASAHPKDYSVYRTPPEDWILVPVSPIIDEELFEAAQEQLAANRRRMRQRKTGETYLLQGFVVCGECGYAYIHHCQKSKGRPYKYYRCNQAMSAAGIQPCCRNPIIRAQELEDAVWLEVCQLLTNPENVEREYQRRLHSPKKDPTVQTRNHLESQLRKTNNGIKRIIDAYAEGLIDKGEFQPRLKSMREQLQGFESQLMQLKDQESIENELKLVIGRLEEFAAKVTQRLDQSDAKVKRDILLTLVKRVEIHADRVKVVFKIGSSQIMSRAPSTSKISSHCCERESDRDREPSDPRKSDRR